MALKSGWLDFLCQNNEAEAERGWMEIRFTFSPPSFHFQQQQQQHVCKGAILVSKVRQFNALMELLVLPPSSAPWKLPNHALNFTCMQGEGDHVEGGHFFLPPSNHVSKVK